MSTAVGTTPQYSPPEKKKFDLGRDSRRAPRLAVPTVGGAADLFRSQGKEVTAAAAMFMAGDGTETRIALPTFAGPGGRPHSLSHSPA